MEKEKLNKNQIITLVVILLLLTGALVRLFGLGLYPNALNVDEASSGYEAFSLLHFGIDRNGNSFPVFLQAWGSGQNALYTYLLIPFVAFLGLSELAIRLPMAIVGCISLWIFYQLLKKTGNHKIAIIGLCFFSICPWHIMKSRWGLESNLFPDLILWGVYFLVKGLTENKKGFFYGSFAIMGLSAYSYGTSYFFLPLFVIPTLLILMYRQKIRKKEFALAIGTISLVTLPMIAFVIINTFNLPQIEILGITIPKLEVNRFQEITSVFSSNFLAQSMHNFTESIKMLITQNDNLPWNAIKPYGTIYLFSSVFTIIGLVASTRRKNRRPYEFLIHLWFIIGILLTFICEPNINRLNIVMIPIIFYTVRGIEEVIPNKNKIIPVGITIMYLISFGFFLVDYSQENADEYYTFEQNLQEPLAYLKEQAEKSERTIYITNKIKEPYIYVLFYTQYSTDEFVRTVTYANPKAEFRQVTSFGQYQIEGIDENTINQAEEHSLFLVSNQEAQKIERENIQKRNFEKYTIMEKIQSSKGEEIEK